MQHADGPITLKVVCVPTAPYTAVLVRGAHAISETQYVILIRGCARPPLRVRGRGEGGNRAHERKSENPINEHVFRKITNLCQSPWVSRGAPGMRRILGGELR
jgi:hypothetical protein